MDELKQFNLVESDQVLDTTEEEPSMPTKPRNRAIVITIILGLVLGLGSGFYLAQQRLLLAQDKSGAVATTQDLNSNTTIKVGDVFGSADDQTFRDQADGILLAGGIDGEGSHHLERGDNKSQWVYVTSSVVDLDLLVGDRVTIWGETNQGKKAGWLMDVGRLKVLELNAASETGSSGTQD